MGERPILFSAPMVRAILDGRKTQTRRVVKANLPERMCLPTFHEDDYLVEELRGKLSWFEAESGDAYPCDQKDAISCPYGKLGDRLWVREAWAQNGLWGRVSSAGEPFEGDLDWLGTSEIAFKADGETPYLWRGRPSIHLPRWASRIDLEITGICVERLQEISEVDALAEGVESCGFCQEVSFEDGSLVRVTDRTGTAIGAYRMLWEAINKPGSWDANPWVWVIEFRRIRP